MDLTGLFLNAFDRIKVVVGFLLILGLVAIGALAHAATGSPTVDTGIDIAGLFLNAVTILSPVILALLGWLSLKAANLIQAKVKNEYSRGVLVRLDHAVFTAVKQVQQTMVAQFKRLSADGKLTEDDKNEVFNAALGRARRYIGADGISQLAHILGLSSPAFDELLVGKIESAVIDLKGSQLAAAPLMMVPGVNASPERPPVPVLPGQNSPSPLAES